MAFNHNQAQQHDEEGVVPEYRLRGAAQRWLCVTLVLLIACHILHSVNQSTMCMVKEEVSVGKHKEVLTNLLCPLMNFINQHVSMSKLNPLIGFFILFCIILTVAVMLVVGVKFNRTHAVLTLIWFILILQGPFGVMFGINLVLALLVTWSSPKKSNKWEGKAVARERIHELHA
ncbi:uncharacterized protein LOC130972920 [Arachis stenosperma]|uniref:uncharacterized protein LOC130972920 n=1 Tax=Arachis stenosperma TaxID=217475 RepID=UPI0025ACBC92|nr:uncharacterized protein LOC130972920 [Arachis stenosperma]